MKLEEELAIVLRGHRAIVLVEVEAGGYWHMCSMAVGVAESAEMLYRAADKMAEHMPAPSVWSAN